MLVVGARFYSRNTALSQNSKKSFITFAGFEALLCLDSGRAPYNKLNSRCRSLLGIVSLLISSEIKQINWLLVPLKSSENHRFSDDFRGNRS